MKHRADTVTRRTRHRGAVAMAALLVVTVAACGDDDDDDAGSSDTTIAAVAPTATVESTSPEATTAATTGDTAGDTEATTADTEASDTTAGESAGPATGDPFQVAVLADLTGPLAANGVGGSAGFQAAIETANADGGAAGHPIELDAPIDTLSTPEGAQAAAVQAISAEPVAILSQVFSGGMAGMVPVLEQGQIPLISTTGVESLSVPTPTSWFFYTNTTSAQQAVLAVGKAKDLLGGSIDGKTVGFIGLAAPSVDTTLAAITAELDEEGATLGATERTASGQIASFSAQAANMAAANPDIIFDIDSGANTVITTKALTDAGYTGPILTSVGANDDAMLEAINLPNVFSPRSLPSVADSEVLTAAADDAGVADHSDSAYFGPGYAAGMLLVRGLDACGFPCSPEELIPALESVGEFDIGDAAFGPLLVNAERHHALTAGQYYVWDNAAGESVADGDVIPM